MRAIGAPCFNALGAGDEAHELAVVAIVTAFLLVSMPSVRAMRLASKSATQAR